MYCIEHFKYLVFESCWDGYVPGGEYLFNQVSSENKNKKQLNKNYESILSI